MKINCKERCEVSNSLSEYSQTCAQRPPLGPQHFGPCWQVVVVQIYVIKSENRTPKWWSYLTGGRNSEMLVNSGLTVNCQKLEKYQLKASTPFWMKLWLPIWQFSTSSTSGEKKVQCEWLEKLLEWKVRFKTGGRCSEVPFGCKYGKRDPKIIAVGRWSLV